MCVHVSWHQESRDSRAARVPPIRRNQGSYPVVVRVPFRHDGVDVGFGEAEVFDDELLELPLVQRAVAVGVEHAEEQARRLDLNEEVPTDCWEGVKDEGAKGVCGPVDDGKRVRGDPAGRGRASRVKENERSIARPNSGYEDTCSYAFHGTCFLSTRYAFWGSGERRWLEKWQRDLARSNLAREQERDRGTVAGNMACLDSECALRRDIGVGRQQGGRLWGAHWSRFTIFLFCFIGL